MNIINAIPASRRRFFLNEFLAFRDNLLNGTALMGMREIKPLNVFFLNEFIDAALNMEQIRLQELIQLKWELFYTDLIFDQIPLGEYKPLLERLSRPDQP
jgi:hypothetical protein